MEEILHHLEPLNYWNSWDFKYSRWCRISSINRIIRKHPNNSEKGEAERALADLRGSRRGLGFIE